MNYFYSYLKTLYFVLGTMGVVYLVGSMATSVFEIPLILVYLSLLFSVVGPVKMWIENNNLKMKNNT